MRYAKGSNAVPIHLSIELSSSPATGVTIDDLEIRFYDGSGVVAVMDKTAPCELVEIDAAEFPGEYLLKNYPVDVTAELGQVKIKWEALVSVCDAGSTTIEVDELLTYARELWLEAVGGRSEHDAENSQQKIYDENDVLYMTIPLENKDGGDVVYTGQGPVTRGKAVRA